jgi:hypothetical protein
MPLAGSQHTNLLLVMPLAVILGLVGLLDVTLKEKVDCMTWMGIRSEASVGAGLYTKKDIARTCIKCCVRRPGLNNTLILVESVNSA